MKKTTLLCALFAVSILACNKQEAAPAKAEAVAKKAPVEAAPKKAASKPAAKPGESAATRDHVDADGVVRRGAKLSAKEQLSVAVAMAKLSEIDGSFVKVTGTVGKVCSNKGCWFVLEEGESKIRITAKDYKFFVPQESVGMLATVEGDLKVKELSKEEAEHLAAEGAPVKGNQKEISITAHGIEMKKKAG